MSDVEFGDIEPDDVYAADSEPDPEQVARRLHELRAYLDDLTGGDRLARFEELTPDERTLADAVGAVIVSWLLEHEPDDPEGLARALHNVRRYWSGDVLPTWDDLPADERDVAVDVMAHIIAWLQAEGPL
jgi:hypothetical protein